MTPPPLFHGPLDPFPGRSLRIRRVRSDEQKWVSFRERRGIEKAKAWPSSKEHQENRQIGEKYAKFRIIAVEGRP